MDTLSTNIPDMLLEALKKQNIHRLTKIQARCYQPIMDSENIVGCSVTGSGKTLAYLLPLVKLVDSNSPAIQALIVVPTQELGMQVLRQLKLLIDNAGLPIRYAAVIGEANLNRQIALLKTKPQIIVGTCGRILKLQKMKKLSVHNVRIMIVDEADKMLAKDNLDGLISLRRCLMKYTQLVFFSASMDKSAVDKAATLTEHLKVIRVQEKTAIPETIKHLFIVCERRERMEMLRRVITALHADKAMVFVNTAFDLEEAVSKLNFHKYQAVALYGSDNNVQRKNALEHFQNGKARLLISTDLASRGLHMEHIDAVINLNLPEASKEYLHRCGRCGRNGNQGACISIICEAERNKIKSYQKDFGIQMVQRKLYKGKLVAG